MASTATRDRASLGEARLAAALSATCGAVLALTLPLLNLSAKHSVVVLAGVLVSWALCGLSLLVPWGHLPRWTLMVLPAGLLLAVAVDSHLTHGQLSPYTGFLTVAFVFAGITQTRRFVLASLPPAVGMLLLTTGRISDTVLARVPTALAVWALIGLLLATQQRTAAAGLDDLRRRADVDHLTGLGNRHAMDRRLRTLMAGDSVVILDLDHFKQLNDLFGHLEGDRVLSDLGAVLRAVARGNDGAYRYGGEEMLLVLPRAGIGGAEMFLDRLRTAWRAIRPEVTFSAGVAVHDGGLAEATVRRADAGLYEAKREGRDRSVVDRTVTTLAERARQRAIRSVS